MSPRERSPVDHACALERDLDSYRPYLLAVAGRLRGARRGDREAASDLVQRALAAAVDKAREGRAPGDDPAARKAWLRAILVNVHRRVARREGAAKRGGGLAVVALDAPVPDPGTSPSGKAARNEAEGLLALAFARLAPEDQQVVRWRYVDDLSCEEIGLRLGCSPSYASRVARRALGRLREATPGASAS